MKKAKADGQDPLLALLDWHNTPIVGLGISPAQRLMGRRTHTFLPTHETLMQQPSQLDTAIKLAERKAKQAQQYNKKFCPLVALKWGPAQEPWGIGLMKLKFAAGNTDATVDNCA